MKYYRKYAKKAVVITANMRSGKQSRPSKKFSLKSLVNQITPDNRYGEVDAGELIFPTLVDSSKVEGKGAKRDRVFTCQQVGGGKIKGT
jgi:Tfp pilus assembly major pilin PilA